MKDKKPSLRDLDKKRFLFFNIGLIASLSLALIAFEWKSIEKVYTFDSVDPIDFADVDHVPKIVPQPEPELPKDKPKKEEPQAKIIDKVKIVDNTQDVIDIITLIPLIDKEDTLEHVDRVVDTSEVEVIDWVHAQSLPMYKGCNSNISLQEQKACYEKSVANHIRSAFKYPKHCKAMGVEGRVYVAYVVDEQGKVTDVNAFRGQECLRAEAERIVSSLPQTLKPAMQRGKAVKMKYSVPIVFKLR